MLFTHFIVNLQNLFRFFAITRNPPYKIRNSHYIVLLFICIFSLGSLKAQDGFTANTTSGCSPLVVTFTYTAGGSPTNMSWDFGNSNTLSGDPAVDPQLLTPSISYILSGTYTVSLTVTTSSGTETYTENNYITVFEDPEPNFSASIQEGCVSLPVSFTDLSVANGGAITQWNWDFGDAGSSNLPNPLHVYNTAGVFDVSLSVTDENGCNAVFTADDFIDAFEGVSPEFTIDPSISCELPTTVEITNLSTGEGDLTYAWDFGNTSSSTSPNPSPVNYSNYGFYVITLTLSNDLGCTQTASQFLNIQEYQVSFDPQLNCLPAPSLFVNTSAIEMNTFEWDFGDPDSGSNTSDQALASHVFSGPGTYTVTLTASIDGECETSTSQEVTIDEAQAIDYSLSSDFVCEYPTTIDISINNSAVDSWSWYLSLSGGDQFDSGNEVNNSIVFDDEDGPIVEGSYSLILSVTYENGCTAFLSESDIIQVDIPSFDLYVFPTNLCEGDEVIAENQGEFVSGYQSETWAWGDNTFDYTTNASHIYPNAGDYELVFSIVTSEGCYKDTTIDIQVGIKSDPDFTWPDTTVCIEEEVQFLYTGGDQVEGWYWYYNGLSVSNAASPLISIDDIDSVHTVSLITVNNGCQDSISYEVEIIGLGPEANFFADEGFYCKEDAPWITTILNETDSTSNTIYQWVFADDYIDSTNAFTPGDLEFFDPGGHLITLIATDTVTGCEHEKSVSVNIDNYHTFFTDSVRHVCDTLSYTGAIMFTDTFPNDPDKILFHWDFGDGDTAMTFSPDNTIAYHFYDEPGDYLMQVTSFNEYGCPDTVSQLISVHPSPIAAFSIDDPNLCPPYDIYVEDQSTEMDTSIISYEYLLLFGNESIAYTEANNSITLESTGPYLIQLNIEDGFGCTDTSEAVTLAPHIINFAYNFPEYLCYNTDYELGHYIESEFPPLEFYWEFGNGTTSDQATPIINIDSTESQSLINYVTVTDSVGCMQTDTFLIQISVPSFDYTFEIDEAACPPIYSDFSMFSDDPIDIFGIDYGDGEANTVGSAWEALNISHVYDTPGVYDVLMTVTDIYGCSASILVDSMISVPGPVASFSFSPNSGCPPLEVTFEIIDQENVDDYFWVFGDGYTSNEESPMHIYNLAGTYTPILVIQESIDQAGDTIPCIVSVQGEDLIIDGPILNFAVADDTLCHGTNSEMILENLTETIPGFEIISYEWDFGDGNQSSLEDPEPHLYADPGFYTITLTVVTENGCEYILVKSNAIYIMPEPLFYPYASYVPSCPPLVVSFYGDSSSFPISDINYEWTFGDGYISNELNPVHEYENEGSYEASLAIEYNGCIFSSSFNENIDTYAVPEAIIEASPLYSNGSLSQFQFTNASIDAEELEWLINGNVVSNEEQITLDAQNDSSVVYLVAFSEFGCSDTTSLFLSDLNWAIPNIISPNGDGLNDYFVLNLTGFGACIDLKILDRWGRKVYENTNYTNEWDGRHQNGNEVSDGTYFYLIEICGKTKLSGYITVVR